MPQISRYPLSSETRQRVYDIFLSSLANLKNKDDVEELLESLLTPTERLMVAKRISVAFLLHKGLDYREISRLLKVSTGTVSRVAYWFRTHHGYEKVIKRVLAKEGLEEIFDNFGDIFLLPGKGRNWKALAEARREREKRRQRPF